MTAAREAFGLPLTLLTVVLIGGIRLTAPIVIAAPTAFSLVLATILMAVFVQSGALDPARLLHSGRPALANFNGLLALVALFLANAQVISRLTPDSGLPALAVSVLLFVTLLQLAAAALDRVHQGRLLTAYVCAGAAVESYMYGLAAAHRVLADGAGGVSLSHRLRHH